MREEKGTERARRSVGRMGWRLVLVTGILLSHITQGKPAYY